MLPIRHGKFNHYATSQDKYNIEIKADKIDDEEIKERERLYEQMPTARYFFNNL